MLKSLLSSLATGQCAFILDTTGPNDTAAWYDLWQAAVALDGMCARGGQAGTARFLGEFTRQSGALNLNPFQPNRAELVD